MPIVPPDHLTFEPVLLHVHAGCEHRHGFGDVSQADRLTPVYQVRVGQRLALVVPSFGKGSVCHHLQRFFVALR